MTAEGRGLSPKETEAARLVTDAILDGLRAGRGLPTPDAFEQMVLSAVRTSEAEIAPARKDQP